MITQSALRYILKTMDYRYNDMQSPSPRYSLGESSYFIDFCVGLLYRCGVLVRHDDVSNTWQVIR